jgi:hypothetical protein
MTIENIHRHSNLATKRACNVYFGQFTIHNLQHTITCETLSYISLFICVNGKEGEAKGWKTFLEYHWKRNIYVSGYFPALHLFSLRTGRSITYIWTYMLNNYRKMTFCTILLLAFAFVPAVSSAKDGNDRNTHILPSASADGQNKSQFGQLKKGGIGT